jgi:putative ABC transport system permease protein
MLHFRRPSSDDDPAPPPAWRRYLRFWGSRVDADVDDELGFHVEMRTRDYLARGYSERDARAAAQARLGDVRNARAACLTIGHRRDRRMTRAQLLDAFVQDLRYALRTLNRQRGWAAVAIVTFALGIGATTTMYSVVNSLVLHPLAYRDANRMVIVWRMEPKTGLRLGPDEGLLRAWRAQSQSIESFQSVEFSDRTLSGRGEPASIQVAAIQPDFLRFAGLQPLVGRSFTAIDTTAGSGVVIIGEHLWRVRFGGSPSVVGSRVILNDKPFTIVGVAPADLRLPAFMPGPIDVWFPVNSEPFFGGITLARLRTGVSIDAAQRELAVIASHNEIGTSSAGPNYVVRLQKPGDMLVFQTSLFLLAGAVTLLLVVACANVAHLLLARGATRERELAVRTALGAGRRRLARQLLTESLVLAAFGCVAGMVLAYGSLHALLAITPEDLHPLSVVRMNGQVLAAAVAISVVTGIAFGLTAAVHAVRRTTSDSLRTGGLAGTAKGRHRLRSALVVSELAISATLLVGALLLVRTVSNLQQINPGFDASGLYSMTIGMAGPRYATTGPRNTLVNAIRARATAIPGVRSVTLSDEAPPLMGGFTLAQLAGDNAAPGSAPNVFSGNTIAPNYFSVVGIPIIEGSTFSSGAVERNDIIINESMARRMWPGQSAVGHRINFASDTFHMNIVGVVGDTPTEGLSRDRKQPVLYFPIDPNKLSRSMVLTLRAARGQDPTVALRTITSALDPKLVPPTVGTVAATLAATIAFQRFTMTILAVFATLAVVLSGVGLYGVISYVVTQRTREIGIRIALGATPRHVARTIVMRGVILSAIGLAIGLLAARWGTTLIASTLYGVATSDAVSYGAAGALLLAISVVACLVPMRRAMSVDPVVAMRGE